MSFTPVFLVRKYSRRQIPTTRDACLEFQLEHFWSPSQQQQQQQQRDDRQGDDLMRANRIFSHSLTLNCFPKSSPIVVVVAIIEEDMHKLMGVIVS